MQGIMLSCDQAWLYRVVGKQMRMWSLLPLVRRLRKQVSGVD